MNNEIRSIWIIGLSAAGKTTLARLLVERMRSNGRPCVLVDGNEVRALFDKKLGYDPNSRRQQSVQIKKLVNWVSFYDVLPIVAIIHPFEDDRVKFRGELPGYYEVFLDCGITECIRRDDKNLYDPALRGMKKHVVGLDIPFDEPKAADIRLDSGARRPQELLDAVWDAIVHRLNRSAA